MILRLRLQNYRNYPLLELVLSRGNIFVGNNAQGKTNILEAVSILSSTKSFRSKDSYLINTGENFLTIEGFFEEETLRVVEELVEERIRKTFQVKGVKKSARDFIGRFVSVIFSPDDVAFLNDSPSVRRRYLDIILSISDKEYLVSLIKYKRILEQRNALLKRIREGLAGRNELDIWDEKLTEFGLYLLQKRVEFIEFVNKNISFFYNELSTPNSSSVIPRHEGSLVRRDDSRDGVQNFSEKREEIGLLYESTLGCHSRADGNPVENDHIVLDSRLHGNDGGREKNTKEIFLQKLKEKQPADIASGRTNIGPHRDDITFLKTGRPMAPYGSRGEYRTAVLALKFTEGKFLEETTGKEVTYLLDDVFSELDKGRRDRLYQLIKNNPFIITTTDLDHIGTELLKIAKVFRVEEGVVENLEFRI